MICQSGGNIALAPPYIPSFAGTGRQTNLAYLIVSSFPLLPFLHDALPSISEVDSQH